MDADSLASGEVWGWGGISLQQARGTTSTTAIARETRTASMRRLYDRQETCIRRASSSVSVLLPQSFRDKLSKYECAFHRSG